MASNNPTAVLFEINLNGQQNICQEERKGSCPAFQRKKGPNAEVSLFYIGSIVRMKCIGFDQFN